MSEINPINSETVARAPQRINLFSADDVVSILQEKGWLRGSPDEKQAAWCSRAAALLGPQTTQRAALVDLLCLVFRYDAPVILQTREAHVVMSRYAARDVLRQLALFLLDGAA